MSSSNLLRRVVADLDILDQIRISSRRSRLEGLFLTGDPIELSMRIDSEEKTIPLEALDTLWVRGNAAGTGALAGGAILGIGAGLLLGVLNQGFCDVADCSGKFLEGMAIGLVIGTPPGVLVGAVVGAFTSKWHRRYP